MPHWRHIKSYLFIQLRTHGSKTVVGTNTLVKLSTLTLWSMDDRIPCDKDEMGGPRGSRSLAASDPAGSDWYSRCLKTGWRPHWTDWRRLSASEAVKDDNLWHHSNPQLKGQNNIFLRVYFPVIDIIKWRVSWMLAATSPNLVLLELVIIKQHSDSIPSQANLYILSFSDS